MGLMVKKEQKTGFKAKLIEVDHHTLAKRKQKWTGTKCLFLNKEYEQWHA
jgi:hypothetical protein